MQVRIIKSEYIDSWYHEMVGQIVESLNESDEEGLYVINPHDKNSISYFIYHGDYEKLSFEHLTHLIGKEINDYCDGYFGREFLSKKIVAIGDRWIVAEIPQDNNRLVFANFKDFDEMKKKLKEWGAIE